MCHSCEPSAESVAQRAPGLSRRHLFAGAAGAAVFASGLSWAAPGATTRAYGVERPVIASTGTWGAQPPVEPLETIHQPPTYIVIHHTASANTTDYSVDNAYRLARSIQSSHLSQGWFDSGQQFTVSRGGHIMEGRHGSLDALLAGDRFMLGAHAGSGNNSDTIGIEHEGTYVDELPTTALWEAMVTFTAYCCQQYGVPVENITSHRDYVPTQCPGDALYAELSTLRTEVAAKLGTTPPPPSESTWPTLTRGDRGFRVQVVQHHLRGHGDTLSVDGSFGPATQAAVKSFQTAEDLTATGEVITETWTTMIVTVRNGDRSEHVRAAQAALNGHGRSLQVDGQFGAMTEKEVRAFQSTEELTVDGIVGPMTWRALVA